MESLVELLAAISAEESSGSDTPSTEPASGHANVSGSVRLVVTEADTTDCACIYRRYSNTFRRGGAKLRNERCQTFKGTVKSFRERARTA